MVGLDILIDFQACDALSFIYTALFLTVNIVQVCVYIHVCKSAN